MLKSLNALIVVDMQEDFMPDGALGIPEADYLIPVINAMMPLFDHVVFTADAHPEDHASFKEWGKHCVQGTAGQRLARGLNFRYRGDNLFEKGLLKDRDSFSGFGGKQAVLGEDGSVINYTFTLNEFLKMRDVRQVVIVGVALDICVLETAIDARRYGYEAVVHLDCTRPYRMDKDNIISRLTNAGVRIIGDTTVLEKGRRD